MPARLVFIACLLLGLCACAGGVVPSPSAAPPFGQAPPPALGSSGLGWLWAFVAGLGLGAVLAGVCRRHLLEMALRRAQGGLLPGDAGRLRLLLALLEELIISAGRRGVVVRLGQWLKGKGRGPGGRL